MSAGAVELAIVGGGAAGLFAAAVARDRGVGCVLIERKARVGSKMLMTANGRCNFTKDIPPERMLADIGEPVASFVRPALEACPPAATAAALRDCGLRIRRMEDGRLFPASGKAADVVHVFGDLLRDGEVPLLTNAPVRGLRRGEDGEWVVQLRDFDLRAANVLVATGGMSFPKTGSVGDGQAFARSLGMRVEPCRAGLVGYETDDPAILRLAGRRHETGASASVQAEGRECIRCAGEVEFEAWGVSGAAVYNCSRWVARHAPREFALRLETPDGVFVLRNPRPRPLKEAIMTVGGVSREAVDPRTMGARELAGLYFAGEVLDIDGPTGGYNLTLAFATASLAVDAVAARRGVRGRGGKGTGKRPDRG